MHGPTRLRLGSRGHRRLNIGKLALKHKNASWRPLDIFWKEYKDGILSEEEEWRQWRYQEMPY
jgi:hypothetical protein